MAETQINVQTVGVGGAVPSYSSADTVNGNKVSNDGHVYLSLFNNGATGEATVTIPRSAGFEGLSLASVAVVLSVGEISLAGPFPVHQFNVQSGDDVGCIVMTITGTGAADVDIAAFK